MASSETEPFQTGVPFRVTLRLATQSLTPADSVLPSSAPRRRSRHNASTGLDSPTGIRASQYAPHAINKWAGRQRRREKKPAPVSGESLKWSATWSPGLCIYLQ